MSINILNKYFYNDINNIIIDYIIVDKNRVKYNKRAALNQFNGRWKISRKYNKGSDNPKYYFYLCNEISLRTTFKREWLY